MLPAPEHVGRPEPAILGRDGKLRRELVYHLSRDRHIPQPPVAAGDTGQIAVLWVVNTDRAVDTQTVFKYRRNETQLCLAAERTDRSYTARCGGDTLAKRKIGIVALKNTALKSAQISSHEHLA